MLTDKATVGMFLQVSRGDRPDFNVLSFCKVTREFVPKQLIDEYMLQRNYYDESNFLDWLIHKEYLEPVPYEVFHLGDYGDMKSIYFGND